MCQFRAIASLNHWNSDELPKILPLYSKGVALAYFQTLTVEVCENFDAAVSAFKDKFDDHTTRVSLHMQLRFAAKNKPLHSRRGRLLLFLRKTVFAAQYHQRFYKLLPGVPKKYTSLQ